MKTGNLFRKNSSLLNEQEIDAKLASKQDTLVSGTNIKTINGNSILGTGDIDINSVKTFNTIELMKNDSDLKIGDVVETLGYYEINDGGGATYKIVKEKSSERQDIEYTEIVGVGFAEIILNDSVHTLQLGIKNDGITDVTELLNNFYKIETNVDKILSSGTHLITDTLYIKGVFRKDSADDNDNSLVKFIFEGNLLYKGVSNGNSVIFYNMFTNIVDGLRMNRTSFDNYIDLIGVWNTSFRNMDINKLSFQKNSSSFTLETATKNIQTLNFDNCYILKTIDIYSGEEGGWTNSLTFNDCTINLRSYNYCVNLFDDRTKQNIIFNNCDMSYAIKSLFYIDVEQKSRSEVFNSSSNCSVTLNNCYFDSNVPLVENENQKNVVFNINSNYMSSYTSKEMPIKAKNIIMNNTINNLGGSINFMQIPCNIVKNGDISQRIVQNGMNRLLGETSPDITKEFIDSNININGNAYKLTFNNITNQTQVIDTIDPFVDSFYNAVIRLKIVSGSCDFNLGFNGGYITYNSEMFELNEEYVLSFSNNMYLIDTWNNTFSVTFQNLTENLVVEIYEVSVFPGRNYIPYSKLHKNAILS